MKENKAGRECPAWCVTDHETGESGWCTGLRHEMRVKNDLRGSAYVDLSPMSKTPELSVVVLGKELESQGGSAHVRSRWQADALARLVENASELTPAQGRDMAATIRETAAQAFPEAEAG